MNTNMIIAKLSNKTKGSWFKMSYISDLPMTAQAKREGMVALKYTTGTFRWGISYKNLKSVKTKDEATKLSGGVVDHSLKWGTWDEQYPELIINHKGQQYVRLYSSPNKSKSTYYLNGRPISKEDLMALGIIQKSYWNKPAGSAECMTMKAGNIQEIF